MVNSWGRKGSLHSGVLIMYKCEPNECYDLSKLDTSQITDMNNIFAYSLFNGDISSWNTSRVTNMNNMFYRAESFNQLLNFNTSNVTSMHMMFHYAKAFNQPLNFDTSKVTDINLMFAEAIGFNQQLNFDTSKVTNMYGILREAKSFNHPLNFDTPSVNNMNKLLYSATSFLDKYNNGMEINNPKDWLKQNRDRMIALSISKDESTPEDKIAIIENKISNNKTTLDELFKEKNIDPNSKIGLELLKVYNDTHDKIKLELEDLKTRVVDIATNDFNNL